MRNGATAARNTAFDMELVGIRECARRLGERGMPVNASTISRQVRLGIIPNRGEPGAPLVDVEEVIRARAQNLDRAKQRPRPAAEQPELAPIDAPAERSAPRRREPSWQDARTERERAQARLAQIQLAEKLGQICDRQGARDAGFELGRALQEQLRIRRDGLAETLALLSDPGEIEARLEAADAELLKALGQAMRRLAVMRETDGGDDAGLDDAA